MLLRVNGGAEAERCVVLKGAWSGAIMNRVASLRKLGGFAFVHLEFRGSLMMTGGIEARGKPYCLRL